jgi:hypothetical protein
VSLPTQRSSSRWHTSKQGQEPSKVSFLRIKRSHQDPNIESPDTETKHVLTLNVTPTLREAMNHLRATYFPRHLNRLAAHLTLFHALPASQLDTHILPLLKSLAASTSSYHIRATTAVRMGKGVLIQAHHSAIPHQTTELHRKMQREWAHFLSKQDMQNLRLHWTVMNKVEDKEVVKKVEGEVNQWLREKRKAKDVEERRKAEGFVTGLTLWEYADGWWVRPRIFSFLGEGDVLLDDAEELEDEYTESLAEADKWERSKARAKEAKQQNAARRE